ncbi:MAG: hypothetical protein NT150_03610 [Bacteroidetes bacterium]|nr:hypothetical protein [Bacteroidota bacterium]
MLKVAPILFVLIAFQLLSCTQEAPQPSYLKIEQFQVHTDYNTQGSTSNKITDAWIYLNDQLLGAYELPCEIPVSESESNKISLVAGIKNTGQAGIRDKYLFYKWFDTTIVFNGGVNTLNPGISYIDSLNFLWNFDFEGNFIPLEKDEDSDTSMYLVKSSPDIFEGSGIGEIALSPIQQKAFLKTNLNLNIPAATKATFLEMNYACDQEIEVGVITYTSNIKTITSIVTLKSTDLIWNKIYIDLSSALGQHALQGKFEIYYQIHHLSKIETKLRLDNLKIISQK